MAAATSEKAVQQILNGLQKRAESLPTDRWGIGTAAMYLRKLAVPENTTPEKWESVLKAAASKLTYCEKGMVIEESLTDKLTAKSILDFNAIITSKNMDRDGDVMEPMGADLDPNAALLFNHMPEQIPGRLVKELSKTEDNLRGMFALVDTALGNDMAKLVEFKALRISHGFLPLKFSPRHSKDLDGNDWEGWLIRKYKILEVSLVGVPSNQDAVITAFSRQKLFSPMVKSWAKGLFDSRPVVVPGIDIPAATNKGGPGSGRHPGGGRSDAKQDRADIAAGGKENTIPASMHAKLSSQADTESAAAEKASSAAKDKNDADSHRQASEALMGAAASHSIAAKAARDGGDEKTAKEHESKRDEFQSRAEEHSESAYQAGKKSVKPTIDDICADLLGVKKKKPAKPDPEEEDDEDEPDQYGDDDDGVGISEKAVAKCAMGIKGCEHFGQAFVNHAQKSVHHTMCPKCTMPVAKAKKPDAKEDDAADSPEPYHTAEEIKDAYMKVPGVQHVTVAKGYHPPLCKNSDSSCWSQVHPVSRAWTSAVQAGGPGTLQNQQQQNNGKQPPPQQGGNDADSDKGFDPMAVPVGTKSNPEGHNQYTGGGASDDGEAGKAASKTAREASKAAYDKGDAAMGNGRQTSAASAPSFLANTPQEHREAADEHVTQAHDHFKKANEAHDAGKEDLAKQHQEAGNAHLNAGMYHTLAAQAKATAATDKSFATPGKKWIGCGIELEGSWEDIRGDLQPSLYEYLKAHGIDIPDEPGEGEPMVQLPWVSIAAMFDDHAIVEVYYPNKPMHAEDQPAYSLNWIKGEDGEPVWDGDPTPVKITTTVTVTADEMNKALRGLRTKAKDGKDSHLNADGTFKGGFDGCCEFMQSEAGGGHSEESAKAICGKINADKNGGKNHRAEIRAVSELASFKTLWSHDGIEAIGGKLKSALKDPCEVQHIEFDPELWTPDEAKSWLKANDYKVKTWTEAAREAARAALEMIHGHGAKEADEKSGKAYEAGNTARDATAKADKSGTAEDHDEAARRNVEAAIHHSAAASAHNEEGHESQAKEHDELASQYTDLALEHKITARHMRGGSGGGGGHDSVGTKPEHSPRKPNIPVDKLADKIQKDDKSGRVLSGSNMNHVQEAMDCHQEILKMGPEHASKACKALVKEAHGHLNDVITQAGPSATEPTVKELAINDVCAFLATANSADVEEAGTILQARKRRNGADGQRQLLTRLLGR